MSLKHTLIKESVLSAPALKALSGPMKLMAARGLAPITDPGDLITVLYQLALDPDRNIQHAARDSAAKLPDKILSGALVTTGLDARVLDFFADSLHDRPSLLQLIILNTATADESIATIAGRVSSALVDLVAQNEQRLLRYPKIIAAMYTNPAARMSTVDRAVELAVRHELVVPGIPAWHEITRAVLGAAKEEQTAPLTMDIPECDDLFLGAAMAAVDDPDAPKSDASDKDIPISQMTIPMKIRLATLGNKAMRGRLVRDPVKLVAVAAIKSPGVNELEASKYASNHSLCDDVISYIARKREWTKLYGVKLSLVQNPKTPIPASIRFLTHLRAKDLQNVARSRGVPAAVTNKARQLLMRKNK